LTSGASGLPGDFALTVFTIEKVATEGLQAEIASTAGSRAVGGGEQGPAVGGDLEGVPQSGQGRVFLPGVGKGEACLG